MFDNSSRDLKRIHAHLLFAFALFCAACEPVTASDLPITQTMSVPTQSVGTASPVPTSITPQSIEFQSDSGIIIPGWFFPAPEEGVPAIILMHGGGGHGSDWISAGLVAWLRGGVVTGALESGVLVAGWEPLNISYNVLVFDYRGNWVQAGRAAVEWVQKQPGVDDRQIATLGGSAGGDGALAACVVDGCVGVLALSPTGAIDGERFAVIEARLEAQGKSVWCVATDGDGGCPTGSGSAYRTWVFDGMAHGLEMLRVPGVEGVVREFLRTVVSGPH